MTARLNHTIVAARDRNASALFVSEILGLEPPSAADQCTVAAASEWLLVALAA